MELGLQGKHIFIAGASRGIGEAMAAAFLSEGANVALTARTSSKLAETSEALGRQHPKAKVWSMAGDMTKTADIARALAGAEAALGPVHTVVANVGIDNTPMGFDVSDERWQSAIEQNFLSGARLAREALRTILARAKEDRRGANIILISSIAGVNALGSPLPYGSMKAALNHTTRELAKLVGKDGVRVNAIAPGNIIFPGGSWQRMVDERPEPWGRWIEREVALQRFGTPKEIADAALFVASDRATFLTGEVFTVDGGQIK